MYNILAYKFIQILPNNKPLIANTINNTWYKDNIILPLLFTLRIKNNFDNLFRNTK